MTGQLAGKIAIVTGAAKGLGRAVAELFVTEGAIVTLTDIDAAGCEAAAAAIGENARWTRHDVSAEADWQRVIDAAVAEFGRLDILVNNAGILEIGNVETTTIEQWRRVNAVISEGTFLGCKHAVGAMKAAGGSIINVSSIASMLGEPYNISYVAAKGAVEAMTRSVAVHCAQAKNGIRCNSIHPGPIATPMVAAIPEQIAQAKKGGFAMPETFANKKSYSALPEELAPAFVYLASDNSKWVNGTKLVIDNTISVTSGAVPG